MLQIIAAQEPNGFGFLLEANWPETEPSSCPGVKSGRILLQRDQSRIITDFPVQTPCVIDQDDRLSYVSLSCKHKLARF